MSFARKLKRKTQIEFLAKSIALLATADIAYFAEGWENARGCRIEHKCAEEYGINIVEHICQK